MAYPDDGDPIRKRCLDALVVNMLAITLAGKYHHEVASAFLLQQEKFTSGEPFPVVIVAPQLGADRLEQELTCVQLEYVMNVAIFGAVKFNAGEAARGIAEAEWLLSDIRKAIEDDSQLGTLATWSEVSGVGTYDASGEIAACRVEVRVAYRHRVGDPARVS